MSEAVLRKIAFGKLTGEAAVTAARAALMAFYSTEIDRWSQLKAKVESIAMSTDTHDDYVAPSDSILPAFTNSEAIRRLEPDSVWAANDAAVGKVRLWLRAAEAGRQVGIPARATPEVLEALATLPKGQSPYGPISDVDR